MPPDNTETQNPAVALGDLSRRTWDWLGRNSSQLQTMGTLLVIVALGFAWVQLRQTARQLQLTVAQMQATTMQERANTSQQLILKAWDDPSLRILFDPSAPNSDPKKVRGFTMVLINHFAMTFRQGKLGNIPPEYWEEFQRDAKDFFKSPQVKEVWNGIKRYYGEDFQSFVDKL